MRVRQILRNLLSNAHKHGGDVIRVGTYERGGAVDLVVADNGDGVPPDKVPRLFTRYVHEGEDPLTVGSVGMGLAVVKTLAEAMDGTARYERESGWSRFVVSLPSRRRAEGRSGSGVVHGLTSLAGRRVAAAQPLEEGWPGPGAP